MDEHSTGYPPNPRYGSGVLRRRIAFAATDGAMNISLVDQFHHMLVRLSHDGVRITRIDAEMRRWPKTPCPAAISMLKIFEGCLIAEGRAGAEARLVRSMQCTHLSDMTVLGISALERGVESQCIEIALTDRDADGCQQLDVFVDGENQLHWDLKNRTIIAPEVFAGRSVFGGFSTWASTRFEGFERDLWQMAQMAVLIAAGREFIADGPMRRPIIASQRHEGACYSFSGEARATGTDIEGYIIDMSDGLPPRRREDELLEPL